MQKQYLHRIDAIRGIAILLVMTFHTFLILFPGVEANSYKPNGMLLIKDTTSLLLNFNPVGQGYVGIDLFLVISGFLIHYIYLQTKATFTWRSFFSKRFWRIYPPYFFVMILFFCLRPDFSQTGLFSLFTHASFTHNLNDLTFFTINPSFWSIALEVQLYLLYPAYIWLHNYFGARKTLLLLLLIQIVFAGLALLLGNASLSFNGLVFKLWFVWGCGALLAEYYSRNRQIFKQPAFWSIALYVCFLLCKLHHVTNLLSHIPAALASIAFIEAVLYGRFQAGFITRPIIKLLSFTGTISYSLYLIHQPPLKMLLNLFSPKTNIAFIYMPVSIALAYVLIFAICYAFYRFMELPSINFGKSFRVRKLQIA